MKIIYRIRYSKTGRMKFIGHLDLLKLFQRALNRAQLPVAYSHGFNPHQLVSFAMPLPIGTESVAEYCDVDFIKTVDAETIKNQLNKVMPFGMEILAVRLLEDKEKNCASDTSYARYEINLNTSVDFTEAISELLAQNKVLIMKKTKSGVSEADIRPDIFEIDYSGNKLNVLLSAGSNRNLKPEFLVSYLFKQLNLEPSEFNTKYTRLEIYKYTGHGPEPLL